MQKQLERSPEVQETVDTIRAESQHSRERAQLGRYEIMLGNASLARTIVDILSQEPGIKKNDLFGRVVETGKVLNPHLTEYFTSVVAGHVRKTREVLEKLGISRKEPEAFAQDIYKIMLELNGEASEYKPQGTVKVDESCPFALILYLGSPEDALKIGIGPNIEGKAERLINRHGGTSPDEYLFVITINRDIAEDTDLIKRHETRHIINELFYNSLEYADESRDGDDGFKPRSTEDIWGGVESLDTFLKLNKSLVRIYENNPQLARESPEYRRLLLWVLARTKDEILSHMEGLADTLIPFKRKREPDEETLSYDFIGLLDLPWGLYQEMWDDFELLAKSGAWKAKRYYDFYRSTEAFRPRTETYTWLLAQVPIYRWEETLESMPIGLEMVGFKVLRDKYEKLIKDSEAVGNSADAEKYQQEYAHYLAEVESVCSEKPINNLTDDALGRLRNNAPKIPE